MTAGAGPTQQWFAGSWAVGRRGQSVTSPGTGPALAPVLGASGWTTSAAGVRRRPCGIVPTVPGDATTAPTRRMSVWSARSGTPTAAMGQPGWPGRAGSSHAHPFVLAGCLSAAALPPDGPRSQQPPYPPAEQPSCILPWAAPGPMGDPRHNTPQEAMGGSGASCPSPSFPCPVIKCRELSICLHRACAQPHGGPRGASAQRCGHPAPWGTKVACARECGYPAPRGACAQP